MSKAGAFTFVLHSHLPYARQAGMWPHGEEWIHEAIAETYVPLLDALHDLQEEGVPFGLTIGITPILAEQLADHLIVDHFIHYAAERAAWAASDVKRFEEAGDSVMRDLARFYHHWYARTLTSFRDRYGSDLIGAFRRLQDAGRVEIATWPRPTVTSRSSHATPRSSGRSQPVLAPTSATSAATRRRSGYRNAPTARRSSRTRMAGPSAGPGLSRSSPNRGFRSSSARRTRSKVAGPSAKRPERRSDLMARYRAATR